MSTKVNAVSNVALVAEFIDNGPVSTQQIIVVALCFLFNVIDGFDISAMAVAVNSIGREMSLAEDKLGLIFSFSLAGMMLGAMFLAGISDIIGRRKVVITSVFVVGLSVVATGYADNLWSLILLRFISGLGAGTMLACQATLTSEYSSTKFRVLSVSIVTAGYPMGAMLTGLVAGEIIPGYGWRGIFVLGGGITLLMGGLAYRLIPESLQFLFENRPANALARVNSILHKLHRDPLTHLPEVSALSGQASVRASMLVNMRSLLTPEYREASLKLWMSFFLCITTLYFLVSWIPKLLINAGLSEQAGNYAFSLFNSGGVMGTFLLGALAARWKLSHLLSIFMLAAAAGMVAFALAPARQNLLFVLIFFVGLALQGGYAGLYAVAAKIYPTEIRSTGVGWAIGLGRFGAVLGPAIGGILIASGVSMSSNFVIFAIPMMLAGIFSYWLKVD